MRLALVRSRMPRALAVTTMAAAALVFAAGPAVADEAVTLNPAHVGSTAAGFPTQDDDCGNGPNEDGWHFIAPANVNFTSLHLEFDVNGSPLIIDLGPGDFGPPDDSHAFVSTPVGAVLTAGSGTTDAATPQGTFNLSHTCPGTPNASVHLGRAGQGYSGILPCFFGGSVSRLVRNVRSALITYERVYDGGMTEST
jgi:hypothetical protein